jgi:thioredoxin
MKMFITILIIFMALFAIAMNRNRSNSSNKETTMSLATSDATFETDVLKSAAPVLVDFWAPWCGPCRMVGPIIDNIAIKTVGKAKVFKLNVDENPATAGKYGITGIPTVLVFRNGALQKQFVGVQQEAVYLGALN